ncbi:MAG: hypothetical protein CL969_04350 [Euryarchaeota archaeon]|jgi:high-affinity iron transporter|nr:hypothetical protein [Euryarchaeota archaeon]|tara:strand:+ start:297 stop:1070 length:774 start_codon:yes stop_codon:yes gene_type:complete
MSSIPEWAIDANPIVAGLGIGLRESLEAILIVGLLATYLKKSDRSHAIAWVGYGVLGGLILSVVTGIIFNLIFDNIENQLLYFESVMMFFAAFILAAVLLHLIKHQSEDELKKWIDDAYERRHNLGLAMIALVSVWREGAETVVFVSSVAANDLVMGYLGVIIGLFVAFGIGYALFSGGLRFEVKTVFMITNIMLLLFGAWMFSTGFWELVEAGAFGMEENMPMRLIRLAMFLGYAAILGKIVFQGTSGESAELESE